MKKDYWIGFYSEAKGFHNAVKNAVEKKKFNPETNYSIITMALEKYLVAYLFKINVAATNHTLSGLMEEIKFQGHKIPESLLEEVFFVDSFQYICSIEGFEMKEPTALEVKRMTNALEKIGTWVDGFVHTDLELVS